MLTVAAAARILELSGVPRMRYSLDTVGPIDPDRRYAVRPGRDTVSMGSVGKNSVHGNS
jgi:hypothetical protein